MSISRHKESNAASECGIDTEVLSKALRQNVSHHLATVDQILQSHVVTNPFFRDIESMNLFLRNCKINLSKSFYDNTSTTQHDDETTSISMCASTAKELAKRLDKQIISANLSSLEIANNAIQFGFFVGMLTILDKHHEISNGFTNTLASLSGRRHVNNNRWKKHNELLLSLTSEAMTKWDEGSHLMHNEMADQLLRENMSAAKYVSRDVLMKTLKPLALERGKLRGVKNSPSK